MVAEQNKRVKPKEILDLTVAASREISNSREKGEVLCDIAELLLHFDQTEMAESMLGRALECAEETSFGSARAIVFSRIASIHADLNDEDRAESLLDEALERVEHVSFSVDQKAEALVEIIDTMIKIRGEDEALDLARDISNTYGKSTALARIAESLAEKGEEKKAKDILDRALEMTERIVFSLERRARAQAEIASALSKSGEEWRALEITRNISFGSQKEKALKKIAFTTVDKFEPERARVVLDETLSIAETIQTDHAKACAYSELCRAMVKNDVQEKTDDILERSLQLAERISLPLSYRRVKAFSSISTAYAEKCEKEKAENILERALKISNTISNDALRAKALTRITEVKFELESSVD